MKRKKILIKGNEAIAEAAIRAGLKFYAGYPITPQNEIPEYMAKELPKRGGVFIQAASEIEAVSMIYGAAAAGARAMTSSSSPGISLKQETISFLALTEIPCLIVNIMRSGPSLGSIGPAQSDYFQATKGGGHGDYRQIVLAPSTIQEAIDLTYLSFDLADKYRIVSMILADGMLGQMMEAVEFPEREQIIIEKPWALTGAKGRKRNTIISFELDFYKLEKMNIAALQKKYRLIEKNETRSEEIDVYNSDTSIVIVAYGTCARIAKTVLAMAKEENIKVGLIRPITLWPFPYETIKKISCFNKLAKFLVVEMSCGQMLEDARLAVQDDERVYFYGRCAGVVPTPCEILNHVKKIIKREAGRKLIGAEVIE